MPRLGNTANLDQRLIERALEYYATRLTETPAPFLRLPAELVVIAHGLARKDWRRLEILDDRTILVHNRQVW